VGSIAVAPSAAVGADGCALVGRAVTGGSPTSILIARTTAATMAPTSTTIAVPNPMSTIRSLAEFSAAGGGTSAAAGV
jgi:hypothetical protein